MLSTESSRSSAQRKRQRLDQLVDRIAHFVSSSNGSGTSVAAMEHPREVLRSGHLVSRLRVHRTPVCANPRVFNFDHVAVPPANSSAGDPHHLHISDEDGEEEVFSPLATTFSDRLTLSPCSSSTVDSPSGISFSPLSFDEADLLQSKLSATCSSDDQCLCSGTPLNLSKASSRATDGAISPPCSSSSPLCPAHRYHQRPGGVQLPGQLVAGSASGAACRRRARSDSDLRDSVICLDYPPPPVATWVVTPAAVVTSITHLNTPPSAGTPGGHSPTSRLSRLEHLRPPPLIVSLKRSSTDSDSSSPLFQESPVDLSMRSGSSVSSTDSPNQTSGTSGSDYMETPIRFSTSSLTSSSSSSRSKLLTRSLSLSQYLSAEYCADLSVESSDSSTMAPPSAKSSAFHCDVCGQGFDLHDRLIKHLASRHKSTSRAVDSGSGASVVKGYQCDVCQRPFARSDMLTRHMRLHTGLKPYTCRICGQVFSRSDHLSTHQRTHTGEKPYRCPQCAYAACRRDMITRHLRTHTRSEDLDQIHDSRKDSTG